jgi:1,4-alpha-glucan branching enzyme
MLQFVDDFHVVGAKDTENLWIGEDDKVLAYKKSNLIFLFNFNPTRSFSEFSLPTLDAGSYKVVFSSDTSEFGGQDRISQEYVYNTKILTDRDNKIGVTIYSPSRTVLVLKKI